MRTLALIALLGLLLPLGGCNTSQGIVDGSRTTGQGILKGISQVGNGVLLDAEVVIDKYSPADE